LRSIGKANDLKFKEKYMAAGERYGVRGEFGKPAVRLNRRELLAAGALLLDPSAAFSQSTFKSLRAISRTLEVRGKPASVFALQGADKLNLVEGGRFSLRLKNDLEEGTIIHWHGLTPPSVFDGSPVSQGIVKHGSSFEYDFVINRSGTPLDAFARGIASAKAPCSTDDRTIAR
jgi:FtsP/CotA-like multicopper oxidase with cupredoxin domain